MIVTAIKCEMCNNAQHLSLRNKSVEWQQLPSSWFTLFPGDGEEGSHFCSTKCLHDWVMASSPEATQPLDTPHSEVVQSNMRRFRLFTDEGDEKQGVLCENGHILIDEHDQNKETHYHSWDECKTAYPGGGVQWIDPEVNNASNGN